MIRLLLVLVLLGLAAKADANLIQMPISGGGIPVIGKTFQSGGNTLTDGSGNVLSH